MLWRMLGSLGAVLLLVGGVMFVVWAGGQLERFMDWEEAQRQERLRRRRGQRI